MTSASTSISTYSIRVHGSVADNDAARLVARLDTLAARSQVPLDERRAAFRVVSGAKTEASRLIVVEDYISQQKSVPLSCSDVCLAIF